MPCTPTGNASRVTPGTLSARSRTAGMTASAVNAFEQREPDPDVRLVGEPPPVERAGDRHDVEPGEAVERHAGPVDRLGHGLVEARAGAGQIHCFLYGH